MKIPWQSWAVKLKDSRPVLLVAALGVLLLLLPTGGRSEELPPPESQSDPFILEEFEEKVEDTLSQITGAGKVSVVLTLDGGSRQVLAQDRDMDGEGGGSWSHLTLGKGAASQSVVPLQTLAPSFRGALVVCPGGEDPAVRLKLVEALSVLTGLGADKIAVCGGTP